MLSLTTRINCDTYQAATDVSPARLGTTIALTLANIKEFEETHYLRLVLNALLRLGVARKLE